MITIDIDIDYKQITPKCLTINKIPQKLSKMYFVQISNNGNIFINM